jgi:hypothetical protein
MQALYLARFVAVTRDKAGAEYLLLGIILVYLFLVPYFNSGGGLYFHFFSRVPSRNRGYRYYYEY